ncbi:short chain dehydrogenase [Moniliophthora roreri]|nr:short chain dehydrogenase [Moniliophthora roreri]
MVQILAFYFHLERNKTSGGVAHLDISYSTTLLRSFIMEKPRTRCTKPPLSSDELQERLRLHDPLPRSQYPEIDRFISDAEHDINAYEMHIHRLLTSVNQYRAKLASLKREIARYKSLRSPIRQLPPELLRHIFILAATPTILGIGAAWESPAFTLASVCVRWRNVATKSPMLWSNICAHLCQRSEAPLTICITRSSRYPLTLALCHNYHQIQSVRDQLQLLLQHSYRWISLRIGVPSQLHQWGTLGEIGTLSLLRSSSCIESSQLEATTSLMKTAPLFDSFVMGSVRPPADFPLLNVRHLSTFQTAPGNIHLRPVLEVVDLCSQLSSLVILGRRAFIAGENLFSERYDFLEHGVPTSSNLISLSVDVWANGGTYRLLEYLFNCLTLPSLKTLSLRGGCHPECLSIGMWPKDAFSTFISRSKCHLTSVELSGLPLTDSDVIAFLQHTPLLEDLALHEQWIGLSTVRGLEMPPPGPQRQTVTKRFCEQLTGSSANEDVFAEQQHPILPKLKRLSLRVWDHFDADVEFVAMVGSRWHMLAGIDEEVMVETLREVDLRVMYSERKLDAEVYKPLKHMESEGLMVTVIEDGRYLV